MQPTSAAACSSQADGTSSTQRPWRSVADKSSCHIRPVLSPQVANLPQSATLAINELSLKLQQEGKTIHRLGLGQSPFPVPKVLVEALARHAGEKDYLPVRGLAPLRDAVAEYYNTRLGMKDRYSKNDIMVGPGSKELLFLLQLCYPGTLFLPMPSWVSYSPQAGLCGGSVKWVECFLEEDWKMRPQDLDKAVTESGFGPEAPKLLILNYPSNPTGASYTADELKELAGICRAHRFIVLSDEIYDNVTIDGEHHSIAEFYPEGTIVLGGLSKWAGAGGWRLGVFAFPPELQWLMEGMCAAASETFSCVAAPIQYAAVEAYRPSRDEIADYVTASKQVIRLVSSFVVQELRSMGAEVVAPKGGFYVMPDFTCVAGAWARTSEEFTLALLQETGVAFLPGTHFGHPASRLIARIAFVDFDGGRAIAAVQDTDSSYRTPPNTDASAHAVNVCSSFCDAYAPSIVLAMGKMNKFLKEKSEKV